MDAFNLLAVQILPLFSGPLLPCDSVGLCHRIWYFATFRLEQLRLGGETSIATTNVYDLSNDPVIALSGLPIRLFVRYVHRYVELSLLHSHPHLFGMDGAPRRYWVLLLSDFPLCEK